MTRNLETSGNKMALSCFITNQPNTMHFSHVYYREKIRLEQYRVEKINHTRCKGIRQNKAKLHAFIDSAWHFTASLFVVKLESFYHLDIAV